MELEPYTTVVKNTLNQVFWTSIAQCLTVNTKQNKKKNEPKMDGKRLRTQTRTRIARPVLACMFQPITSHARVKQE